MAKQDQEFRNTFRDKFEKICEGLGEALLQDDSEFKMIKADMTTNQIMQFCEALCPKYFEVEEE